MEIATENLSTICRLCACKKEDMTSIFDSDDPESDVLKQIGECLPIIIRESESVSKLICKSCKENLKKFYEFRNNVVKKNEIFEHTKSEHKSPLQISNINLLEDVEGDENNINRSTKISCRFCSACNQVFFDKKSSAKHDGNCQKSESNRNNSEIREIVLNSVLKCEFCDRCYVDAKSNRIHKASHVDEKPYVCMTCDIYYSTYEEVTEHKTRQCKLTDAEKAEVKTTIPKYFSCLYCDKAFMYFRSMNIHQNICNVKAIDRFKCCHCGDRFIDSKQLAEHNSSEVNKKWQCQRCPISFGSVCALRRHKKKSHDRQFICADCGKDFLQKPHLAIHVKNHMGEKTFPCDLCDKAYKIKSELNKHMKSHIGELPYKCNLCDKSFSTLSRRRNHMKCHNNPKLFRCNVCDRGFKRYSAKKIHLATHTGEKAFKCDACDKAFKRKADLRKHKRTRHGFHCRTVALIN